MQPRRSGRPGVVIALLWTLALQMSLPVAHATAHAVFDGSTGAHCGTQQDLRSAGVTQPDRGDEAACPVCQSLHAKPAVRSQTLGARALCASETALCATSQRIHAGATHRAHAPRAPPLEALSLA
jgi:hypothetical protein